MSGWFDVDDAGGEQTNWRLALRVDMFDEGIVIKNEMMRYNVRSRRKRILPLLRNASTRLGLLH